jgi:hypothetical protein
MPGVNRTIVASVIIIMAAGIYHYFLQNGSKNTTLTRIIVGAYMLGLFASFFDLVGFGVGRVAGWILMLAMGVAIFTVVTDLVKRFQGSPAGSKIVFGGSSPSSR